jgi:hypothetical protein
MKTCMKPIQVKPGEKMKTCVKPIVALAAGAILLTGALCQTARAQNIVVESDLTPSILAPTPAPPGGYAVNPQEYLSVAWEVTENLSDSVYTYYYDVSNPSGDVLYNSDGSLGTTLEDVAYFSVDFPTTGNYVPGTIHGGGAVQFTANTIEWLVNIPAGGTSGVLQFDSDIPPTLGNATSSDSAAPAPWTSANPDGTLVPVPVPEPATTTLLALTALLLLPFRSNIFRFMRGGEKAGLSR